MLPLSGGPQLIKARTLAHESYCGVLGLLQLESVCSAISFEARVAASETVQKNLNEGLSMCLCLYVR